ncbi:MAG: DUF2461 domain-containing protein [Muribaculaceae bacterium]|nr:DUF2461 domain-containing protein [Muribaculaceae bacterium]
MIDRIEFFEHLRANNNREWFAAHRAEYDEIRREWIDGMNTVHALVSEAWPEVRYAEPKTFRIYRDTRFSSDKTPYKTHIGSTLAPPGATVHLPGAYIESGIPQEDSGVFVGIWCPEAPVLKKLRHAIVDNIEEWEEIVHDPEMNRYYGDWIGERLKTAPKGWPKDHPQIEYLRLKHIGKVAELTRRQFAGHDWPRLVADRIIAGLPLLRFLHYSLTEE